MGEAFELDFAINTEENELFEIFLELFKNTALRDEVRKAIQTAKENCFNGKPVVIIMKTIMGNGVNYMMGTHKWHGVAPNDEELEIALNQNPETLNDY